MVVGIPREIKDKEYRVSLTPAGVKELVHYGHHVIIETNAGAGSSFEDDDYLDAGGEVINSPEEVFVRSELICKVKEPQPSEYPLIKSHHIIFTYFHFASNEKMLNAMIDSGSVSIAYETIEDRNGRLPLLMPMSQIAGRLSVQEGINLLLKSNNGKGLLAGGIPGVKPSKIVIIGGGTVGTEAAKMAAGLGANVSLFDVNLDRLTYLSEILPPNVTTLYSNHLQLENEIRDADLIIGAILVPGGKTPKLITREMLSTMQKGTVLLDVAVDQGGCIETIRPTTHSDPTYVVDGIIHYGVANMPGSVPVTATKALTNATIPYIIKLADWGWERVARDDAYFSCGINVANGYITYRRLAEEFDKEYRAPESLMS